MSSKPNFLTRVFYTINRLAAANGRNPTVPEISSFMQTKFDASGDVYSQIETTLNKAVRDGYCKENSGRYGLTIPMARMQNATICAVKKALCKKKPKCPPKRKCSCRPTKGACKKKRKSSCSRKRKSSCSKKRSCPKKKKSSCHRKARKSPCAKKRKRSACPKKRKTACPKKKKQSCAKKQKHSSKGCKSKAKPKTCASDPSMGKENLDAEMAMDDIQSLSDKNDSCSDRGDSPIKKYKYKLGGQ